MDKRIDPFYKEIFETYKHDLAKQDGRGLAILDRFGGTSYIMDVKQLTKFYIDITKRDKKFGGNIHG